MRIMFIGAHYHAFHEALEAAGHELMILDYWRWFSMGDEGDARFTNLWAREGDALGVDEVNARCVVAAREFIPDVVVVFKGWKDGQRKIWTRTMRQIKNELNSVICYWSVDDPDFVNFWKHDMSAANLWDVALTCCKASVEVYRNCGVKDPHYFLPAYDPAWPVDDSEAWDDAVKRELPEVVPESIDVSIVGSPYWSGSAVDVARTKVALACIDAGFSVKVFGPEVWTKNTRHEVRAAHSGATNPFLCGDERLKAHYGGMLQHDDVWIPYRSSKIVFNNHLRNPLHTGGGHGDAYLGYCNDKLFQIAGTGGGTQLIDWNPGISPDVYEADVEILEYKCSRSDEECLDAAMSQIHWLLENEDKRREISAAAKDRTFRDHLWSHRADHLLEIVESHVKSK
ncbi:MAG: glycosyltransferase [Aliifodinibius sp.]|nr:glycosyltransferase [Fodinibius sp.]NIY27241.1 glycosyltransferase [Fodinibius sp.]